MFRSRAVLQITPMACLASVASVNLAVWAHFAVASISAVVCCFCWSLSSLLCWIALWMKPWPIAIIIGICCALCCSNCLSCGSSSANSLSSAPGAVSLLICSANLRRSSSVTGSLLISLTQSAFILATSAAGSAFSSRLATLFVRRALTEASTAASGAAAATGAGAGAAGAAAVGAAACWLQPTAAVASAATNTKRVSGLYMGIPGKWVSGGRVTLVTGNRVGKIRRGASKLRGQKKRTARGRPVEFQLSLEGIFLFRLVAVYSGQSLY